MDLKAKFFSQARFGPLCILPFNQLMIDANGDCYPCEALRRQPEFNLGNIHKLKFQEIWNGDIIKSFRRVMLEGKKTHYCDIACHGDYETSCKSLNPINSFPKFLNNIHKIKDDGSVDFLPSTFFLKTSNICNLACQYCKEESSNTWAKTNNKIFNKTFNIEKQDVINQNLIDTVINNSNDLECIYFSGGEPSIVPSYSLMLEQILYKKGNKLKVASASNVSVLNNTSKRFFSLINEFNNATVFCSIDSYNETNDFIRMFSSFTKTKETFKYIKDNYKNIDLFINSVISIFNILSIYDFHKEWYDEGLLKVDSIRYVLCEFPEIFNILYLSDDLREKIIDKFLSYIKWLRDNEQNNNDYPNNGMRNYIYLERYIIGFLKTKYPLISDFLKIRKKQKEYLKKINTAGYFLPKSLKFLEDEFNRPVCKYNKNLVYTYA